MFWHAASTDSSHLSFAAKLYCLLFSRGVVKSWICCERDTLFFLTKAILSRAFILDLLAQDLLASAVLCSIAFRSNHLVSVASHRRRINGKIFC